MGEKSWDKMSGTEKAWEIVKVDVTIVTVVLSILALIWGRGPKIKVGGSRPAPRPKIGKIFGGGGKKPGSWSWARHHR